MPLNNDIWLLKSSYVKSQPHLTDEDWFTFDWGALKLEENEF